MSDETPADRVDPPFQAPERPMLEAWLDYHRATLLWKCADLPAERLRQAAVPPSDLSLLGLVRHMTEVERYWFREVLHDEQPAPLYCTEVDPDGDFDGVGDAEVPADMATYRAEVDAARVAAARCPDLDVVAAGARPGDPVTLRWILVHMVEEYARHNGHADLIRERLDGRTGD